MSGVIFRGQPLNTRLSMTKTFDGGQGCQGGTDLGVVDFENRQMQFRRQ